MFHEVTASYSGKCNLSNINFSGICFDIQIQCVFTVVEEKLNLELLSHDHLLQLAHVRILISARLPSALLAKNVIYAAITT